MLMEMAVKNFINLLSSDAPAPGGGSVAALNGALGAGLLTMVCRLSIGRKELHKHQSELISVLEEAEKIRSELSILVDRDTDAFNQVMDAYKMPKTTDHEKAARKESIQDAFYTATEVPLQVSRLCCSLLASVVDISPKSNSNTAIDLGVSALCFYGAIIGALMNLEINIPRIEDAAYTSKVIDEAQAIRKNAEFLKIEMDNNTGNILSKDNKIYMNERKSA